MSKPRRLSVPAPQKFLYCLSRKKSGNRHGNLRVQ